MWHDRYYCKISPTDRPDSFHTSNKSLKKLLNQMVNNSKFSFENFCFPFPWTKIGSKVIQNSIYLKDSSSAIKIPSQRAIWFHFVSSTLIHDTCRNILKFIFTFVSKFNTRTGTVEANNFNGFGKKISTNIWWFELYVASAIGRCQKVVIVCA